MPPPKPHLQTPPPKQDRTQSARPKSLAIPFAILAALSPLSSSGPISASDAKDPLAWAPLYDTSRVIAAGSPLDFSRVFRGQTSSPLTPVRISKAGQFVTGPADSPIRQRFFCASLAWSPASGSYPDHKTADQYAEQLRRHGYNLARFHFTDAILMSERDKDFDFDPVQLDRFHYLMAALKKNGVYWMIDILSSQNGAIGGVYPHRWDDKHNLKMRLHVEEAAKAHWQKLAKKLLATKNPYTGLAPAKDPALALVITTNENNLEFTAILEQDRTGRAYAQILQPAFNRFLNRRYKTDVALKQAWGRLSPRESLKTGTIRLPLSRRERGPRMRDLQAFFLETEKATFDWSKSALRDLGYAGPVSAYNNWSITPAHLARGHLPAVTMNAYHDIVLSFAPGTSIKQSSSLTDAAEYIRDLIGSRWHVKPFLVTEHQHLFWNRHRYEAGLLIPALAGLQDWDGICRHGPGPIELDTASDLPHKRHILPYAIGLDPIARASETLAALIYRRGDAKPANTKLVIPHASETDFIDDGQGRWPDPLTRLGLISSLALASTARPDTITIDRKSFEQANTWLGDDPLDKTVKRLRANKALPTGNVSDPSSGIFQSDTGQLTLDTQRRRAIFVSAQTEAIAFDDATAPVNLGSLTLQSATSRGLLALSALDDKPLDQSGQILIIYATDARNSGMKFSDSSEKTILEYGARPTILKRGRLTAILKTKRHKSTWTVQRLDLAGRVIESRDVLVNGGKLILNIETAQPGQNPTTFWFLTRKVGQQPTR